MSESLILSTSGVKQGRKRKADADHAISILDLTRRQYTVNVRGERGVCSLSFTRKGDTLYVTRNSMPLIPEWATDILRMVNQFAPDSLHVITTNEGTTNE